MKTAERREMLLGLGSLHHLAGVAIRLGHAGLVMTTVGRIAALRTRLRWLESTTPYIHVRQGAS